MSIIKNKNKIIIIGFCCCLFVSIIYGLAYKLNREKVANIGLESEYQIAPSNYVFFIDSVKKENNILSINGCCLQKNNSFQYINRKYILIDENYNVLQIPTIMINRPGTTEYFNDGCNYDDSGLSGQCKISKLLPNHNYIIGAIIKEQNGSTYIIKSKEVYKNG